MKLAEKDSEIYRLIRKETEREEYSLILIASENYVDEEILEAQGCVLTNKYAEGYPAKRYYSGCTFYDEIEDIAIERAKTLFKAEHANVQPHSGSSANMAVFYAVLNIGDTILGMDIAHGGHLTHGAKVSFSGKFYRALGYTVSSKDEMLDYDEIRRIALREKPKMIIAGASAYSRDIDFAGFRRIADEVGAILMVDMAHFAGLVAAGIHSDPVPQAEFVTTTTHKTLRGPRGGMVLCRATFAEALDHAVFPGIQGGPLMHVIAAKAVALREASQPSFKRYQQQVVKNARALAAGLQERGLRIVSGGTDTHLILVDLTAQGVMGSEIEAALDEVFITVNKNNIPFDDKPPSQTSGIRLGTPAVTTRGMREAEMIEIADLISLVIKNLGSEEVMGRVRERVDELVSGFPLYPDL